MKISAFSLLFFLLSSRLCPAKDISVDFDNVPLREVIFLVSEYTGAGFVLDSESEEEQLLTWVQRGIAEENLVPVFTRVLASVGYTINILGGTDRIFVIRSESTAIADSDMSVGTYHLRYIPAESVTATAKDLYGDKLSVVGYDNQSLIYSGSPMIVAKFSRLLSEVDIPPVIDSSGYLVLVPIICIDGASARCLFNGSWFPRLFFPHEIIDYPDSSFAALPPALYDLTFGKEQQSELSGIVYIARTRLPPRPDSRAFKRGGRVGRQAGAVN